MASHVIGPFMTASDTLNDTQLALLDNETNWTLTMFDPLTRVVVPAHDSDPSPIDGLTCAERHGLIVPIDRAGVHLEAEHPNGSLTILPVLAADYPSSEALI